MGTAILVIVIIILVVVVGLALFGFTAFNKLRKAVLVGVRNIEKPDDPFLDLVVKVISLLELFFCRAWPANQDAFEPLEKIDEVRDHGITEDFRLAVITTGEPLVEMFDQLAQLAEKRILGQ